ncbi:hypothetical protein V1L52_08880 [Treponema sp. HNW]|uniref:hypothetical protein n=1 Tax=Treponema sp. HNW TaxID=3116654 RepID=UPI003D0FBF83
MKKTGASAFVPVLLLIFLSVHTASAALQWTVAARAFNFEEENAVFSPYASSAEGAEGEKIGSLLPRLILERASDAGIRNVLPEELYRRRKRELLKERRSLYESLEKAVYERDKLIASDAAERKLYENIAAKEKDIQNLRGRLEANQKETSVLNVTDFKTSRETITVWKKDAAQLYPDVSDKKTASQAVQNGEPEDINALITGRVMRSGSYIKADVFLILYPGGIEALKISETDTIENLDALAAALASRLEFALQNTKKVRLFFDIHPREASEKMSVRLDGRLLNLTKEGTSFWADIRGGIHDLYVEAEGYKGASFVYDFSGSDDFYVSVSPERQNHIPLNIKSDAPLGHSLFFNGLPVFPDSDKSGADSRVFTVNGFPVLAELQFGDGLRRAFLLTKPVNTGMPAFNLPVKQGRESSGIETKRKIMYNSYAAFIVSLPVSFVLFGKHIDEYNSWARGNNIRNDLEKWQTAYYTAAGISAGLGINFLVQLGLYLHAANSVLPEKIVPEKNIK